MLNSTISTKIYDCNNFEDTRMLLIQKSASQSKTSDYFKRYKVYTLIFRVFILKEAYEIT